MMYTGTCCAGKSVTKRIMVGGQQIGISFFDKIIEEALASGDVPEEELKSILLRELKIYNYVPSSTEDEYLVGIWAEYVKERARRSK